MAIYSSTQTTHTHTSTDVCVYCIIISISSNGHRKTQVTNLSTSISWPVIIHAIVLDQYHHRSRLCSTDTHVNTWSHTNDCNKNRQPQWYNNNKNNNKTAAAKYIHKITSLERNFDKILPPTLNFSWILYKYYKLELFTSSHIQRVTRGEL